VASQAVTITQEAAPPPCAYTVNPLSATLDAVPGAGAISVTTTAACAWTAASNDPWISISAGAAVTGSGTVRYSVTANDTGKNRNGTLTVASQTVAITQKK